MNRLIQLILLTLLTAGSVVVVGIYYPFERIVPLETNLTIRDMVEVPVNYTPELSLEQFPFYGAAVLDMKGRGEMVTFVSGGKDKNDAFLVYATGQLIDISQQTLIRDQGPSYGASAIDVDDDGDTDLLVAREKQVYWYANNGGSSGDFESNVIPVGAPDGMIFIDVAPADYNNDGYIDLLISAIESKSAQNMIAFHQNLKGKLFLLAGDGKGNFTDNSTILGETAALYSLYNIWADFDKDGYLDFIGVTPSQPLSIWRNNQGQGFIQQKLTEKSGLWGGLSVQDFDQDGDLDILATNIGNSIPDFLLDKGGLPDSSIVTDWQLFYQTDDGFVDSTYDGNLIELGNGRGAVHTDLNLDGQLDLIVAQNHPQWFVHNIRMLTGKTMVGLDKKYFQTPLFKAENPSHAGSPVIADILSNGKPDILWLNIRQEPRVLLNKSESTFVSFVFPDNRYYQGAMITASFSDGSVRHQFLIGRSGLGTDNSNEIFFGLNNDVHINTVQVTHIDGSSELLENVIENERNIIR